MLITEESLRLKFRNMVYLPCTSNLRRKGLHIEEFTIISNNCWAGTVYESYGLKKLSPTIGMFIMPEDYLKLVCDLDYFFSQTLEFVEPDKSKWCKELEGSGKWKKYLIGRLGDVELHMLHYNDQEKARKKWESRVKRINRNYLIVKFNDQNGATQNHIKRFMELPIKNKLCFVGDIKMKVCEEVIFIEQPMKYKRGIMASREPFGKNRFFDVTAYINSLDG